MGSSPAKGVKMCWEIEKSIEKLFRLCGIHLEARWLLVAVGGYWPQSNANIAKHIKRNRMNWLTKHKANDFPKMLAQCTASELLAKHLLTFFNWFIGYGSKHSNEAGDMFKAVAKGSAFR